MLAATSRVEKIGFVLLAEVCPCIKPVRVIVLTLL
jgi:hypothetical protein